MKIIKVIWTTPVRDKLLSFRSEHFTDEETYDFIVQVILETEDLLLNPVLGKTYVEEFGEYKGVSRVIIRRVRVYYEQAGNEIVVVAVKFPGEK